MTTPLWQRMTAAGTPPHVVADQITAVWDWLHEALGDYVPNVVYNSLSQQAIEAVELVEEAEPAEVRPVGPTADQQAAIDGILDDICSPAARPVLCGYAGTGKTFTTAELVSRLTDEGSRVVVAAPTHKARSQVERALRSCGARGFEAVTLHRLLGLKKTRDKKTGEETFERDPRQKNMMTATEKWDKVTGSMVDIPPIDVVIVDESSMVGGKLYDLLLSDAGTRPVVFVGDDRQLLPVGEDQACRAFTEGTSIYRLTEVLRHDGAILNLATATRMLDVGRARFTSAEGGGSRVIAHRSREQWFSSLLEMAASEEAMKDPDFCRALAYTNTAVNEMNAKIHRRRYGVDAPQFVEGMTCITVDAIPSPIPGDLPLLNSTVDVLIKEAQIVERKMPGDLPADPLWKVWEVTVSAGETHLPVTFLVMTPEEEKRWRASLNEIASDAKASSGKKQSELWDLYWERGDAVGNLQPASALTIHKSQGSTFENVFLHWSIDGYGSAPTAQQNQLAYVGITRAAQSLHVVGDR